MSLHPHLFVLLLACLFVGNAASAQDSARTAKPITLANVDELNLLSEFNHDARYCRLGPGPNELLLFPRGNILVVDDQSFQVLRIIDQEKIRGFSFSQDRTLTSWLRGSRVIIENQNTGKTLELEAGERPGAAVFSPDNQAVAVGDMVITGSEGQGSSLLRIFDTATGNLIQKLEITVGGYGALTPVFSPDGKTLAVGNRNYQTKLFDAETWELKHTLAKRMTHEIAFSPDGKTLAAGYVDGTIALWDVESGEAIHKVASGCHRIHSVAWNPAGDLLATSGPSGRSHGAGNSWIEQPGKVLLWNPKTCTVARELMKVQWSGSVRFTSDGTRLVATVTKKNTLDDNLMLAVWSTNAPAKKKVAMPQVTLPLIPVAQSLSLPEVGAPNVALSPDGDRVVASLGRKYRAAIWNLSTGEQELQMDTAHTWQIWQVAYSPDGSTVATASLDKSAMIYDAKTGQRTHTLTGHVERLNFVQYSPSGKYLLTATSKQWPYTKPGSISVRVWDTGSGRLVSESEAHIDNLVAAVFTPDDKHVLTASADHTVRKWDIASGKEAFKLDLGSRAQSIAFGPDGKTILTTCTGLCSNYVRGARKSQAAVQLWDATSGEPILRLNHPQAVKAAFDDSGNQIVTACRGLITYWDAASGEKLTTLREPLIGTEVIFRPNGKHFVVLSPDGRVELWSVSRKVPVGEIKTDKPFQSFFADDGRTFYTLTRGGVFRAWSLDHLNERENKSE